MTRAFIPSWQRHWCKAQLAGTQIPRVLRVQSNGVRDHQGMRHNHCLTSPIYRQKVEELLNHLIDAVGDHPG